MKSNIGVQLFPVALLFAAVGYLLLGAKVMSGVCTGLAVIFWLIILSENSNN